MPSVRIVAAAAMCIAICVLSACAPSEIRPPELPDYDVETQAALDQQRNKDDLLEQFPEAVVPEVERIAFIGPDEWAETIAACLNEDGFSAVAQDGGLASAPTEGQELPFAIATYVCNAKYPINPRTNVELNDDQLRYLYEYYTQVLTPCLNEEGFDVPEPPSLQTYVSSWRAGSPWDPYGLVVDALESDDEWTSINKKCPQTPDGLFG